MEIAFNERTGRDWSRKQLKNHWDQMKKEWVLFKSLMRGESGLGWDPIKKTIAADDGWWAAKIAVNREFKKFVGKDLSLFWFRYDAIFSDIAATGMRSVATTEITTYEPDADATDTLPDVPTQQEHCDSSGENSLDKEPIQFEASSIDKKRKRTATNESVGKQKVSGATSLRQNISDLVEIMKSGRSTASSKKEADSPTIKECLDVLHGFPPDSLPTQVRYYASVKFAKKEIREIFMGQPNDDERIGLLKFLYDEKDK